MIIKILDRLARLDQLIRTNRTGTAEELAQKLGISRRQLYNYFDEMKAFGLEIEFDRYAQTFRYCNNVRLKIHIKAEPLSVADTKRIDGGSYANTNFSPVQLYCTLPTYL
jgi:hypothetical protein